MAKEITVGMWYTSYGTLTTTIPDDIKNEDIPKYLEKHLDQLPLPSAEYVPDSEELDLESIKIIEKK